MQVAANNNWNTATSKIMNLVSQSNICCWLELKVESRALAGMRDSYSVLALILGSIINFWVLGNTGQLHQDTMNKKSSSHLTLVHISFQMGKYSRKMYTMLKEPRVIWLRYKLQAPPPDDISSAGRLVKNN